jgi:hypothetical protein
LIDSLNNYDNTQSVTNAEMSFAVGLDHLPDDNYLPAFEYGFVGAGVGGGFTDTHELHTMVYDEAMGSTDAPKWKEAVHDEYKRMEKYKVFKPVPAKEVPKEAKILSSKWVMKKKSNGTFRAHITARGYEQIDGEHYDEDGKASPVVDDMTIRMILVLIIMAQWTAQIVDVQAALLLSLAGGNR